MRKRFKTNNKITWLLTSISFFSCGVIAGEIDPRFLRSSNDRSLVTLFDVGQGVCGFISCPNGDYVMVDCGSVQGITRDKEDTIKNYLEATLPAHQQTVENDIDDDLHDDDMGLADGKTLRQSELFLRTLFVSHPHRDHYNLISKVLPDGTKVGTIVIGGNLNDYTTVTDGRSFKDWVGAQKDLNGTAIYESKGHTTNAPRYYRDQRINPLWGCHSPAFPEDGLEILGMNAEQGGNNSSIILKYTYKNYSVVFPGDAEASAENRYLFEYAEGPDDDEFNDRIREAFSADMLIVGHHGSESSSSDRWLDAILPTFALYPSGIHSGFWHPRCIISTRIAFRTFLYNASAPHPFTCASAGSTGGYVWQRIEDISQAHFNIRNLGTIVTEINAIPDDEAVRIRIISSGFVVEDNQGNVTVPQGEVDAVVLVEVDLL